MNRFLGVLFFNALILGIFAISNNCMASNSDTPSIEVKGQASILTKPDRFSLTISITEQGQITDKIRAIVDNKSNQVVQMAQNLGIKSQDINSARVNLRIIERKPSIRLNNVNVSKRMEGTAFTTMPNSHVYAGTTLPKTQENSKPQHFELSRTININFLNIETYDQFLNKAIKLDVTHIYPLAMSVEDTEKSYQEALVQALRNAKNKAMQIASHSNVTLGKLLKVTEQSSNYYRSKVSSARMSSELLSNHSSQVGNQVINASILVKFAIQE
jgi:uncharacterized protein YggE